MKNFKDFTCEHRINWIYIIIFCILFSLRVCAINNKTTFFFDDPASLNVSTPNNLYANKIKVKYGWADLRFDYQKNYDVLSIKKTLFESKSDLKSIISDLAYLHNNTLDRQHPNLYYSILRIWTAGMDYSDNNAIKWRCCSINLIFFILAFFFMFKLLNEIKPDKNFIAAGLFFAFITTGTISNTLLIRAYPMMEAFFIFVLYMFVVLYKSIGTDIKFSRKQLLLYSLGLSIFLLSEYYSLIVCAGILLVFTYKCVKKRDLNSLKRLILIYAFAFLVVLLFCPIYFENFKAIEHMDETQSGASIWNLFDFHWYGLYMIEILDKYVYYNMFFYMIFLFLLAIGVPILGKDRFNTNETKIFIMIFAMVTLYAYLICAISPFHDYLALRYIIITFPIFGLLIAFFVYQLKRPFIVVMAIIAFLSSALPIFGIDMYNSKYKCLGMMTYFRNLSHLDLSKYEYDKQTNRLRPVVIANKNWIWPNYLMYLDNNNIIRFEMYNIPPNKKYIFDDYILINTEIVNVILNSRKKQ